MNERKFPPYRPGWTVTSKSGPDAAPLEPAERGDQRLAQGLAAESASSAFQQAHDCQQCLTLRQQGLDPEALCDRHLGQALGMSGGWALGAPGRKLS